jgi:arsenate reductase
MVNRASILFICTHNSGRSQIAEAYAQDIAGLQFSIESAGLEPASQVNPLVVEVMKEEGFDLSQKKPQSVFELFQAGKLYSHVVTVCRDSDEQCPVFPGITQRWYWPFPDPAQVEGTPAEKLEQVRRIRDAIKAWLTDPPHGAFSLKRLLGK